VGLSASGATARIPDQTTMWQQEGSGARREQNPVIPERLQLERPHFRRTIAIDTFLSPSRRTSQCRTAPVTLYPFG